MTPPEAIPAADYPPAGAAVALALVDIHGAVRAARAVLANDDLDVAIPECLRLLRQVDHLLLSVAADLAHDGLTWRNVQALRDELGGYLLASETLRDVGAKPNSVVALLERGVALADATL